MGNEAVDIREKELRRKFRTIRKRLGEEGRAALDARIEANLAALPEFAETDVLLACLDFGPEVRTRGIIQRAWDDGKTVALPWCVPGYGGGFYDTFLSKFDGVSVGLCREAQFSEDLVAEGIIDAHDLPARLVVTEERIIRV